MKKFEDLSVMQWCLILAGALVLRKILNTKIAVVAANNPVSSGAIAYDGVDTLPVAPGTMPVLGFADVPPVADGVPVVQNGDLNPTKSPINTSGNSDYYDPMYNPNGYTVKQMMYTDEYFNN